MRVDVLRLAGQDLVADDNDAGGFRHALTLIAVKTRWPARPVSKIELAAAHEKITLGIGADVLALLIEQLRIADWAVVPPIFVGFDFGRRRFSAIHG
jgi:hypothetical protein